MAASKEGIARARQILENDRREINKVEEHYAGGGCKNCPAKKCAVAPIEVLSARPCGTSMG